MKILTVLGARPQFVKSGNISREIEKHNNIQEIIVHTGQHYDQNMNDIFFNEMKLTKPNYFLNIKAKNHGEMTAQMMEKLEPIIMNEQPDWVLVYGDTNSTLAGALVASKLNIKLVHIEAGLRSYNMNMPEEINRILTDRISNILCCPTQNAVKNLQKEGFDKFNCQIINSGDVMFDGIQFYKQFMKKPNIKLDKKFLLCTIHRAENTNENENLINIFKALNEIAQDVQIILPLHPRTKNIISKLNIKNHNINIIEPVGYFEMLWLLENSNMVITDSGGLQKEAYFFQKYCIILREETEWIELVDGGYNIIAGANNDKIIETYKLFKKKNLSKDIFNSSYFYGDGKASKKIINTLILN